MIAGVHQKSTFRMKEIPADVGLPCEEKDFASGVSCDANVLRLGRLTIAAYTTTTFSDGL
jgi:hypothetical protein